MIPSPIYKCKKCHIPKDISEFPPDKRKPIGHQSVCRECRKLDQRERNARRREMGIYIEKTEKYCPMCDSVLPVSEFYKATSSADSLSSYCKMHMRLLAVERGKNGGYKKHRQYLKGSGAEKRYWTSDKGKLNHKKSNARRRTAVKVTVHTLTVEEWNDVLASQNYRCNHCDRRFSDALPPTLDHIKPVSLGGDTTKENTQALCQECNSRKGNRWIG